MKKELKETLKLVNKEVQDRLMYKDYDEVKTLTPLLLGLANIYGIDQQKERGTRVNVHYGHSDVSKIGELFAQGIDKAITRVITQGEKQ